MPLFSKLWWHLEEAFILSSWCKTPRAILKIFPEILSVCFYVSFWRKYKTLFWGVLHYIERMKTFKNFIKVLKKFAFSRANVKPLQFFSKNTQNLLVAYYIRSSEWRLFPNFIKVLKKFAFPRANVTPSNFVRNIYSISWECITLARVNEDFFQISSNFWKNWHSLELT